MIKSLKQYLSLRGLLARRLRIKKREIEAIKAKNRFYTCQFGVYDLSEVVGMLNYRSADTLGARNIDFVNKDGYCIHQIQLPDNDKSLATSYAILQAVAKQLKQIKAYD